MSRAGNLTWVRWAVVLVAVLGRVGASTAPFADWSAQFGSAVKDARAAATTGYGPGPIAIVVGSELFLCTDSLGNGGFSGTNSGLSDVVIAALNTADGSTKGSYLAGSTNEDACNGIAYDSSNNVLFATGYTYLDLYGAHQGGHDTWVIRLSWNGSAFALLTQVKYASASYDTPTSIHYRASDNRVILFGSLNDLGGTIGGLTSVRSYAFAWLVELDGTSLAVVSERMIETESPDMSGAHTGHVYSKGLAPIDSSSEAILILMAKSGTVEGSNAHSAGVSMDVAVVRMNTDGSTVAWSIMFGSAGVDDLPHAVVTDSSGHAYVGVHSASPGICNGNANLGDKDIFVFKFNGGTGAEMACYHTGTSSQDTIEHMIVDSSGNLIVAGFTHGHLAAHANAMDAIIMMFDSADLAATPRVTQWGTASNDVVQALAAAGTKTVYGFGISYGDMYGTNQGDQDIWAAQLRCDGTCDQGYMVYDGSCSCQTCLPGTYKSEKSSGSCADVPIGFVVSTYGSAGFTGSCSTLTAGHMNCPVAHAAGGTPAYEHWGVQLDFAGDVLGPYEDVAVVGDDTFVCFTTANGVSATIVPPNADPSTQWWVVLAVVNSGNGAVKASFLIRSSDTNGGDYCHAVAVNPAGNVVWVAVETNNDLGGANAGSFDTAVLRFEWNGHFLKQTAATKIGDTVDDVAFELSYRSSDDKLVASGHSDSGTLHGLTGGGQWGWVLELDSSTLAVGAGKSFAGGTHTRVDYVAEITGSTSWAMGMRNNGGTVDGASSNGGYDGVIAKCKSDGTACDWVVQMGTAVDDAVTGLAVDPSGNVYVAMYTGGNLCSGATNAGGTDAVVLKLNGGTGAEEQCYQGGSSGNDYIKGVALDLVGNLMGTIETNGNWDGTASSVDMGMIYFASADLTGTARISQWGGTGSDWPLSSSTSVVTTQEGTLIGIGLTNGALYGSFAGGPTGGADFYLYKISCLYCPPGYEPASATSCGCSACASNYYKSAWGGTACSACPAGTVTSQSDTGQASCYSNSLGAAANPHVDWGVRFGSAVEDLNPKVFATATDIFVCATSASDAGLGAFPNGSPHAQTYPDASIAIAALSPADGTKTASYLLQGGAAQNMNCYDIVADSSAGMVWAVGGTLGDYGGAVQGDGRNDGWIVRLTWDGANFGLGALVKYSGAGNDYPLYVRHRSSDNRLIVVGINSYGSVSGLSATSWLWTYYAELDDSTLAVVAEQKLESSDGVKITQPSGAVLDGSTDVVMMVSTYNGTVEGSAGGLGDWDAVVVKSRTDGTSVYWSQQLGSTAADSPYSLALDTSGNVYVGLHTRGSVCSGTTPLGEEDIAIVKLNGATGSTEQCYQSGSSQSDTAPLLFVESSGSLMVIITSVSGSYGALKEANSHQAILMFEGADLTSTPRISQWGHGGVTHSALDPSRIRTLFVATQTSQDFYGTTAGLNDIVLTRIGCGMCPDGYQPSSTTCSCDGCAAGTAKSGGVSASACSACAAGSYQPYTNQTSCLPAPEGSYVSGTGQTTFTACAAGTYSSGTGSALCTEASAGYYVPDGNSTSQTECLVGSYTAATGSLSCTLASEGHFVSVNGSASQTPCPENTYQDSTGSISCKACEDGLVASEGSSACEPGCENCVDITVPETIAAASTVSTTVAAAVGTNFVAAGLGVSSSSGAMTGAGASAGAGSTSAGSAGSASGAASTGSTLGLVGQVQFAAMLTQLDTNLPGSFTEAVSSFRVFNLHIPAPWHVSSSDPLGLELGRSSSTRRLMNTDWISVSRDDYYEVIFIGNLFWFGVGLAAAAGLHMFGVALTVCCGCCGSCMPWLSRKQRRSLETYRFSRQFMCPSTFVFVVEIAVPGLMMSSTWMLFRGQAHLLMGVAFLTYAGIFMYFVWGIHVTVMAVRHHNVSFIRKSFYQNIVETRRLIRETFDLKHTRMKCYNRAVMPFRVLIRILRFNRGRWVGQGPMFENYNILFSSYTSANALMLSLLMLFSMFMNFTTAALSVLPAHGSDFGWIQTVVILILLVVQLTVVVKRRPEISYLATVREVIVLTFNILALVFAFSIAMVNVLNLSPPSWFEDFNGWLMKVLVLSGIAVKAVPVLGGAFAIALVIVRFTLVCARAVGRQLTVKRVGTTAVVVSTGVESGISAGVMVEAMIMAMIGEDDDETERKAKIDAVSSVVVEVLDRMWVRINLLPDAYGRVEQGYTVAEYGNKRPPQQEEKPAFNILCTSYPYPNAISLPRVPHVPALVIAEYEARRASSMGAQSSDGVLTARQAQSSDGVLTARQTVLSMSGHDGDFAGNQELSGGTSDVVSAMHEGEVLVEEDMCVENIAYEDQSGALADQNVGVMPRLPVPFTESVAESPCVTDHGWGTTDDNRDTDPRDDEAIVDSICPAAHSCSCEMGPDISGLALDEVESITSDHSEQDYASATEVTTSLAACVAPTVIVAAPPTLPNPFKEDNSELRASGVESGAAVLAHSIDRAGGMPSPPQSENVSAVPILPPPLEGRILTREEALGSESPRQRRNSSLRAPPVLVLATPTDPSGAEHSKEKSTRRSSMRRRSSAVDSLEGNLEKLVKLRKKKKKAKTKLKAISALMKMNK